MIGYDQSGNRLGLWAVVHYDRYLSNYCVMLVKTGILVFQKVTNYPVEPFDLPIKKIINEK